MVGELGNVALGRIVERELSLVAQPHDAERREALRHRRDPEDGVGIDRRLRADVAVAGGPDVRQPAVDDDAVGDARHARPLGERLDEAVDLREGRPELLHALRIREDRGREPVIAGRRRLRRKGLTTEQGRAEHESTHASCHGHPPVVGAGRGLAPPPPVLT